MPKDVDPKVGAAELARGAGRVRANRSGVRLQWLPGRLAYGRVRTRRISQALNEKGAFRTGVMASQGKRIDHAAELSEG